MRVLSHIWRGSRSASVKDKEQRKLKRIKLAVLRKNVNGRGSRVGSEARNECAKEKKKGNYAPSTEPSVRETSDVKGKTSTDNQTRRFQHLRHT